MHEIGVLNEAVKMAESVGKANNISKIKYLSLEIGELTGYLPIFFEKYFPVVVADKPLFDGAELRLSIVKGQALCEGCETLYNVLKNEGKCPACGSRSKKILSGQEFIVKEIGV